jgi:hypothetical protein
MAIGVIPYKRMAGENTTLETVFQAAFNFRNRTANDQIMQITQQPQKKENKTL